MSGKGSLPQWQIKATVDAVTAPRVLDERWSAVSPLLDPEDRQWLQASIHNLVGYLQARSVRDQNQPWVVHVGVGGFHAAPA